MKLGVEPSDQVAQGGQGVVVLVDRASRLGGRSASRSGTAGPRPAGWDSGLPATLQRAVLQPGAHGGDAGADVVVACADRAGRTGAAPRSPAAPAGSAYQVTLRGQVPGVVVSGLLARRSARR